MNRLVFVTGASAGIGAGIVRAARGAGASVASVSRREGPGIFHSADLSDPTSWSTVVDWMEQTVASSAADWIGFAHCAATLAPIGPAADVDLEAYARNVLLNSAAPQVLGAGFLGFMKRRNLGGSLLHISSGAATTAYPGWTSYGAAKAAVAQWTRTAGLESTGHVKVMCVAPGVVATAMQALIRSTAPERFPKVERFRDLRDEGKLADPDDVGARLWDVMCADHIESGAVLDLRNL